MIVPCRRPSCDQLTRTAFREIGSYCSPECSQAHTQAHRVTVSLSRRGILAIADQLDGADADSRFVAEQLRAAVELPPYVGFDDYPEIGTEPAARGWLGRAINRLKATRQEGSK